jgi:hypothetical protein
MQLAVPRLRSASALRAFNEALARKGHDLLALRDEKTAIRGGVGALGSDVLDADGGAAM